MASLAAASLWLVHQAAEATMGCGPAIAAVAPVAEEAPATPPASDDAVPKPPAVARSQPSAWWPGHEEGRLNIVQVRPGAFSKTIVIETDGTFESAASAASTIRVTTADGQSMEGRWMVAASKHALLLPVPEGRYQLRIGESLSDGSGKAIAKASTGFVEVR